MSHYSNPSEIKAGVIGYGGAFDMGHAHLEMMQESGMVPTAVAELDADRLAVAEADFPGIETYDSVDRMLAESDVNFVSIITPHNTHAPLALQCLEAGRHVCCEKPMAITTEECESMIAAAKAGDLVLTTFHNRHWDGCILKAVEEIREQDAIGEIQRVEAQMGKHECPGDWWRSSKSISGGILYDWGRISRSTPCSWSTTKWSKSLASKVQGIGHRKRRGRMTQSRTRQPLSCASNEAPCTYCASANSKVIPIRFT